MHGPHLISRATLDVDTVMREYPPVFRHPHKQLVQDLLAPPGKKIGGTMSMTRWGQEDWPTASGWADSLFDVTPRPDGFDYHSAVHGGVEWHLNFAHSTLFVAYGGPLFAQDEVQVAEHPPLASVHEWLRSEWLRPDSPWKGLTREDDLATPILIRGAPRMGSIYGLYGNAFGRAIPEEVRMAVRPLQVPTITNIIAMEAPTGGVGSYTEQEIWSVLSTAYTGFRAAVAESGGAPAVVHTGHWGTGAYGGNRVLMATIQMLAAAEAGISHMVFHAYDAAGMISCEQARAIVENMHQTMTTPQEALEALARMGFQWGESNGT